MTAQTKSEALEFPKVRIWAILGDSKTGKSTVIGGLTSQSGKGPGGIRDILLRGGGYLRLFARRRACQEGRKSPEQIVHAINSEARRLMNGRPRISVCWLNVLLALRFDEDKGCPAGHEYLTHFVRQGWQIESLVLMNYRDEDRREFYHNYGAPTLDLRDSRALVQNPLHRGWVVGQVRNHFGWA
jgi:hypothetical protein